MKKLIRFIIILSMNYSFSVSLANACEIFYGDQCNNGNDCNGWTIQIGYTGSHIKAMKGMTIPYDNNPDKLIKGAGGHDPAYYPNTRHEYERDSLMNQLKPIIITDHNGNSTIYDYHTDQGFYIVHNGSTGNILLNNPNNCDITINGNRW